VNTNASVQTGCWRRIGVLGGDHSCERLVSEIHCRNCTVFRDAARGLLRRELDPLPPLSIAVQEELGEQTRSVLRFRLGQQWLGLPCEHVAEVAVAHPPRRIAHRGAGSLEGLVAVRGELHLCVALIEVLELGHRADIGNDEGRLVLLAMGESAPIAFRASEVSGLQAVPQAAIGEVPSTLPPTLSACMAGVIDNPQGRMALLAGDRLAISLEQALFR
jgi:chemotaxis-related protein WspD